MTVITAAKHAANTTAAPTKRTTIVELDASLAEVFNELADVKLTLSEAKTREAELVAQVKAAAGMNKDKGETLVLRVAGVIRAKVSLRGRSGIDGKKLQEAFPEAYEACKISTEYQSVNPA